MFKKSIAATLLMIVVAWAELAMAPMLGMHLWPTHPAQHAAAKMTAHHHAMPAGHPCCPKVGESEDAAPIELVAASLPCQNEHRCCIVQGSQNPPAPVNSEQKLAQEVEISDAEETLPPLTGCSLAAVAAVAISPPPSLFGTVLRI